MVKPPPNPLGEGDKTQVELQFDGSQFNYRSGMLHLPVHAVFLGITNRRKEGTYFSVPLSEGDTGGGKISFHLFALLEIVYWCCRSNFSSTAEDQDPLRCVARRQRNASPLMKGDKVRGLLNVLSGVSSRQETRA